MRVARQGPAPDPVSLVTQSGQREGHWGEILSAQRLSRGDLLACPSFLPWVPTGSGHTQQMCELEKSPLWPDEVVQARLAGGWANVSLNSRLVSTAP